jgi:hypothetical protein
MDLLVVQQVAMVDMVVQGGILVLQHNQTAEVLVTIMVAMVMAALMK